MVQQCKGDNIVMKDLCFTLDSQMCQKTNKQTFDERFIHLTESFLYFKSEIVQMMEENAKAYEE